MNENNELEQQIIKKEKKLENLKIISTILVIVIIIMGVIIFLVNRNVTSDAYKPIIYLYPTQDLELTVGVKYKEKITCSYPKYDTQWNVYAQTDGELKDLNTGRNLYALYYECENTVKFKMQKNGFIVKGEDVATFLEQKLDILGLNEKESEEFIVYWLPKLQANKYNYIRFAEKEEIEQNMPIEFSTQPDTLIRVLMTYKGLNKPIEIQEQSLTPAERNGFVAVEWGGTEIK